VLTAALDKLGLVGALDVDADAQAQALTQSVGDEIGRMISEQQRLEGRFEELVGAQQELRGQPNRARQLENQARGGVAGREPGAQRGEGGGRAAGPRVAARAARGSRVGARRGPHRRPRALSAASAARRPARRRSLSQAQLATVTGELRSATQQLCRNLKDSLNVSDNMAKVCGRGLCVPPCVLGPTAGPAAGGWRAVLAGRIVAG
jgi:hypothetical protein